MLRIAVCDDHNNICSQVEDYTVSICRALGVECEVDVHYDGESLCNAIESGEIYELIFLDIEMKKINGIEVGAKIRGEYNDELLQIVYISANRGYALELFEIRPLDFIIKPLTKDNIEKVISRYLKITGFWSDVFTYKIKHDSFKVKVKDIVYLESKGRKIILHSKHENSEFYGNLETIYTDTLQRYNSFLFIHKSYIVNYDYVHSLEYDRLFLYDKTELPIAQSKRKEVRAIQKLFDKRGE